MKAVDNICILYKGLDMISDCIECFCDYGRSLCPIILFAFMLFFFDFAISFEVICFVFKKQPIQSSSRKREQVKCCKLSNYCTSKIGDNVSVESF